MCRLATAFFAVLPELPLLRRAQATSQELEMAVSEAVPACRACAVLPPENPSRKHRNGGACRDVLPFPLKRDLGAPECTTRLSLLRQPNRGTSRHKSYAQLQFTGDPSSITEESPVHCTPPLPRT